MELIRSRVSSISCFAIHFWSCSWNKIYASGDFKYFFVQTYLTLDDIHFYLNGTFLINQIQNPILTLLSHQILWFFSNSKFILNKFLNLMKWEIIIKILLRFHKTISNYNCSLITFLISIWGLHVHKEYALKL